MVIFHSYVKLPEGNIHWKFINYSSLKRSVRCQLPASRFRLVISLRRQSIDAIVYDDLSLGGSHGRGWISMGGSQWCFFSISRTSFSWKMLKVCIDIYCIFGIGTAHRGNSQKVRDNERQDPSGISGFLLTILVDKSPQSSWAKWGIPSPIGSGWPCPPAIWTRCPPITTWRTGDSGWSTQSKPTDAQTELVGDCVCVFLWYDQMIYSSLLWRFIQIIKSKNSPRFSMFFRTFGSGEDWIWLLRDPTGAKQLIDTLVQEAPKSAAVHSGHMRVDEPCM